VCLKKNKEGGDRRRKGAPSDYSQWERKADYGLGDGKPRPQPDALKSGRQYDPTGDGETGNAISKKECHEWQLP